MRKAILATLFTLAGHHPSCIAHAATEEQLLEPHYVVSFDGSVAQDISRSGEGLVRADSRPGGSPERTVMEFALPTTDPAHVLRATLSVSVYPYGLTGEGPLDYALFGFKGDGILSAGEGLGGVRVAGPFRFPAEDGVANDLSKIDATQFIRQALADGASHVGFALRDTNTKDHYLSYGQEISGGYRSGQNNRPPLLIIHVDEENSAGEASPAPVSPAHHPVDPVPPVKASSAPVAAGAETTANPPAAVFGDTGQSPAPLLYWPLDSNALHHIWRAKGTLQFAPSDAMIGSGCFQFDQGFIYNKSRGAPGADSPRTISLWFRTKRGVRTEDILIGWGGSNGRHYTLGLDHHDLRLETGNANHTFQLSTNAADGRWHHAFLTYPGGSIADHRLYLDGQYVGSPSASGLLDTYESNINVGAGPERDSNDDQISRAFTGWIDDAAVFDVALPASDAALVHGAGRIRGFAITELDTLRRLWSQPEGSALVVDGKAWIRSAGLPGPLGNHGGSWAMDDAFIVLDDSGNGLRMATSTTVDKLPLTGGSINYQVGFGKSDTVAPELHNTSDGPVRRELVWEPPNARPPLEDAVRNLDHAAGRFLDPLADRQPFSDGHSGTAISVHSGFFNSSGGNKLLTGSWPLPYTGGEVKRFANGGRGEYFTHNCGDLFTMVGDFEDTPVIKVEGYYVFPTEGELSEFALEQADGTSLRVFVRIRSFTNASTDYPALYEVFVTPDSPDITTSTSAHRFTLSGLPSSCRIHYLMFGRANEQPYPAGTVQDVVERYFQSLAESVPWAWAESWSDVVEPGVATPVPIRLDARGLEPGIYTTRYAVVSEGTDPAAVPGPFWQELTMRVGAPDFTLPEPILNLEFLAGSLSETVPFKVEPGETGTVQLTGASSDQPWLLPSVSESTPNQIDFRFETADLTPGDYSANVAIDSASTHQLLTVRIQVEPQEIIRLRADPRRDRLYALHAPDSGESRLLVIDSGNARPLASIPLDEEPGGFDLSQDGGTLYVIHRTGSLWTIDPETFEVTSRRNLSNLGKWDTYYDRATVAAGPGTTIYLSNFVPDAPLLVFDAGKGELLQELPDTNKVADIIYHPVRSQLFTWNGSALSRFDVDPSGRLTLDDRYVDPGTNDFTDRYGFFRLSRDGQRLFLNAREIDPDNLGRFPAVLPGVVFAMTPNAEVLSVDEQLLDLRDWESKGDSPTTWIQEVSSDYSKLFYFNFPIGRIDSIDLRTMLDDETLGHRFEPADGTTVMSPEIFRWKPVDDATGYHVYLADTAEALADPAPAHLVGMSPNAWLATSISWQPGKQYHWRVDGLDADGTPIPGEIRSFRVSGIVPDRTRLIMATVTGFDGRSETISITTTDSALPWTASSDAPWIELTPAADRLRIGVNAESLNLGDKRAIVTIAQGDDHIKIPVVARIANIGIGPILHDPDQPFVYLFNHNSYRFHHGAFLIRFNTETETYDRLAELPRTIGKPALHPIDRTIYFARSTEDGRMGIARFDLDSFRLLGPPTAIEGLPDETVLQATQPIIPGPPGHVFLGIKSKPNSTGGPTHLVDTERMAVVTQGIGGPLASTSKARAFDPVGQFLYLNLFTANHPGGSHRTAKYRMQTGTFVEVLSRPDETASWADPLTLSKNGNRLWGSDRGFDSNLHQVAEVNDSYRGIQALTANGELAIGSRYVYNGRNGLPLASLRASYGMAALTPDELRIYEFERWNSNWKVTDLAELTGLTGRTVVTDIPDDSIRFNTRLPLTWQDDAKDLGYRVYLGTDAGAVAAATPDSPEFLGATDAPGIAPSNPLTFDQEYFWRIDVIGYTSTRQGDLHSFRTASFDTSPLDHSSAGLEGIPMVSQEINLNAPVPVEWAATTSTPWIQLLDESGSTPSKLRFTFNTDGLDRGTHPGTITFTSGGRTWDYPVSLVLKRTNITISRYDEEKGLIYGISQNGDVNQLSDASLSAYLVVYDAVTATPLRSVAVGEWVSDLRIHHEENRIYIANRKADQLRVLDRDTLDELDVIPHASAEADGENAIDFHSLLPGAAGRILVAEGTLPAEFRLVDTSNGAILSTWSPGPLAFQSGGMVFLPGNRYAIVSDVLNGLLYKLDTAGDQLVPVASISSPLLGPFMLLDPSGSRISCGKGVFDADLNLLAERSIHVRDLTAAGDLLIDTSCVVRNPGNDLGLINLPYRWQAPLLAEAHDMLWHFMPGQPLPTSHQLSGLLRLDPEGGVTPLIEDEAMVIGKRQVLSWERDPKALSYNIYFGTDPDAIASATPDSPEFAGTTENGEIPAPGPLALGGEYFWRIDAVGYAGARKGATLSFHVAPLEIDPPELEFAYPERFRVHERALTLTTDGSTEWTASTDTSWITILTPSGTTPDTLRFSLDSTGFYRDSIQSGSIRITTAGQTITLPVRFQAFMAWRLDVASDRERPRIYVLGSNYFAVMDAVTEDFIEVLPLRDSSLRNISVHYPENRIYLTDTALERTVILDRDTYEIVATHPHPSVPYDPSVQSLIHGAGDGRFMLSQEGVYNRLHLADSATGEILSSSFVDGRPHYWDLTPGTGVLDPTGRWFFHVSKDGTLLKFDTDGDQIACVDSVVLPESPYTWAKMMSNADGSRYFWSETMFDAELNTLWDYSQEFAGFQRCYATATDAAGDLLFVKNGNHAIGVVDVPRRKLLFNIPDGISGTVYNEASAKVFGVGHHHVTVAEFTPLIHPRFALPGLRWANFGTSRWTTLPGEPGTITAHQPVSNRFNNSVYAVHVPAAATVTFEWRCEDRFSLGDELELRRDGDYVRGINMTTDWSWASVEVADGGAVLQWQIPPRTDGEHLESIRGYIRNISVFRNGPIRPDTSNPDTTTAPAELNIDSDGDGSPDLIEWSAGGRVDDAGVGPAITHFVENDEFVFQFDRRLDLQGTTLVLESSTDLVDWQELGFPDVRQIDINATHETLETRIRIGGAERFLRLRAEAAGTP